MEKRPILELKDGQVVTVTVQNHFHETDKERHGWNVLLGGKEYALWVPKWDNEKVKAFEGRKCVIIGEAKGKYVNLKYGEPYGENVPTPTPTPEDPQEQNAIEKYDYRQDRVERLIEAYVDVMLVENELLARHADDEAAKERIASWFNAETAEKIAITWTIAENGRK